MQTIEVSLAPYIGPRCGQNYSIMGTLQSWSVAVDNIRSEVLPLPNLFIKPRTQRHAVSPAFLSFHATHHGGPERRLLLLHETFMKSQIRLFPGACPTHMENKQVSWRH